MSIAHKTIKYLRKNNEKAVLYFDFSDNIQKDTNIIVHLLGKGSNIEIYSTYKGAGKMASNITISVFHEAHDTKSRIYFRAAIDNNARVAFSGNINVKKSVKNANARLDAKALLLSEKSSAFIKPDLEIDTDEVKASHGASIGHLNPHDMFYLTSRGISKTKAKNMIVEGFLNIN